jgi:hypothetical protein
VKRLCIWLNFKKRRDRGLMGQNGTIREGKSGSLLLKKKWVFIIEGLKVM